MSSYKTIFCPFYSANGYCPTYLTCPYYHSCFDQRREPIQNGRLCYSNIPCKVILSGSLCRQDCTYSHNYYELNSHPFNQKELFLNTYKRYLCLLTEEHPHQSCWMYHSYLDRRRPFEQYSCEKCSFFNSNHCLYGEKCAKAHNNYEKFYHPQRFKTKYCNEYVKGKCQFENTCSFAHTDEELAITPIHQLPHDNKFYQFIYKTVWCPFHKKHNKALCEYAHNWQDFRRRPDLFQYTNAECPHWNKDGFIREYSKGCLDMALCKYCHGWKELLYHPINYKKGKCTSNHQAKHCPYYHSSKDYLNLPYINNEIIQYLPAKRNVRGNINDMMLERAIGNCDTSLEYLVFDDETGTEKYLKI